MRNNGLPRKARLCTAGFLLAVCAAFLACDALGGVPMEWGTYTVVYRSNNENGQTLVSTYRIGTAEYLNKNVFHFEGHALKGWATYPRGRAVTREYVNRLVARVDQSITLYAIWDANTYGVMYVPNGGTGDETPDEREFTFGLAQELKPVRDLGFTHDTLVFHGWARNPAAGEWEFADRATVRDLTPVGEYVVRLYALWGPEYITITFVVPEDAVPVPAAGVRAGSGVRFPDAIMSGHALLGWSLERPGGEIAFGIDGTYVLSTINDITLYAVWYYVGFDVYINWFASPLNTAHYTTAVELEFFEPVPWLVARHITINDGTGSVTTGELTDLGNGQDWLLELTDISGPGTVQILVDSPGILRQTRPVTISAITWNAAANNAASTTAVNFEFSVPVPELTANHIKITGGTGAVTTGALTGGGSSWSLEVYVTTPGTVQAGIVKTGVASAARPVAVGNAPAVTGITVNPGSANVVRGETQSFTAVVSGIYAPPQSVNWSIAETERHSGTAICANGVLTVAAAESLAAFTVRATSTLDSSMSGTATVNVTVPAPAGVEVYPAAATVIRGGEPRQFTATVTPQGAEQNVVWNVNPAPEGVSINPSGLLTVGGTAAVDGAALTVTATVPDTPFTAAATVTVTVPPAAVSVTPETASVPRGGTRQFNATVEPVGAPQNVEWTVAVEPGGILGGTAINPQGLLTIGEAASGTLTVLATVPGAGISGAATVTVAAGDAYITITLADLRDPLAREIQGPRINLRDGGTGAITLAADPEQPFHSITWLIGARPLTAADGVSADGATLTVDYGIHGNRLGTHRVTVQVEVLRNGVPVPYSRSIAFEVGTWLQ